MKKTGLSLLLLGGGLLLSAAGCRQPEPFPEEGFDNRLSGGENSVFDNTSQAFGHSFPRLNVYELQIHGLGDKHFEQTFVTAPAPVNSGLGPAYNNVSCISCHHNDGIGIPTTGGDQSSLLIRISLPGTDAHGGPAPVPGFGGQLQDKAIFGKAAECQVVISHGYQTSAFPDGETYELRTPTYTLTNAYLPIGGNAMISPRLAPPVFGLGLLEAIPEYEIVAGADVNDANGDGISGRPNYVWDPVTRRMQLGRFGWKANTASILVQVAAAYNQDIGVTSSVFPTEAVSGQPQFDGISDDPELPDSVLNAVRFYIQTLAVPARRNVSDPRVQRGEALFAQAKCSGCHLPTMITEDNVGFRLLSNQRIHPYTDMLLHDMGPGLADRRPDFSADGQEWRTSPLWGVGLFETVNFPAYYLHDGRARTLIEAIMWHGGEAQQSKTFVAGLSKADRMALLAFLGSL